MLILVLIPLIGVIYNSTDNPKKQKLVCHLIVLIPLNRVIYNSTRLESCKKFRNSRKRIVLIPLNRVIYNSTVHEGDVVCSGGYVLIPLSRVIYNSTATTSMNL